MRANFLIVLVGTNLCSLWIVSNTKQNQNILVNKKSILWRNSCGPREDWASLNIYQRTDRKYQSQSDCSICNTLFLLIYYRITQLTSLLNIFIVHFYLVNVWLVHQQYWIRHWRSNFVYADDFILDKLC